MDIITLDPTTYDKGKVVNGLTSKLWVERYRDPGEFKFTCEPTNDIRTQLALGTLISHTDTLEVMMVEDHEIVDDENGEGPKMTITGRSVDAFLENRLATANSFPYTNQLTGDDYLYDFTAANSWDQAVQLIKEHIFSSTQVLNTMDNIPNCRVLSTITATESPQKERVVRRGQLYPELIKILEESNSGIKVTRPYNTTSTLDFIIHAGANKAGTVVFSWMLGDVSNARYFWSNRSEKNAALVVGKYYTLTIRPSGPTGFGVKMMWVDASDYDQKTTTASAADLAKYDRILTSRGKSALGKQKVTHIIDATIDVNNRYAYRKDYNIGDIVYVVGNYGVSSLMRVTEHAETEDESGESGYPSLSAL